MNQIKKIVVDRKMAVEVKFKQMCCTVCQTVKCTEPILYEYSLTDNISDINLILTRLKISEYLLIVNYPLKITLL